MAFKNHACVFSLSLMPMQAMETLGPWMPCYSMGGILSSKMGAAHMQKCLWQTNIRKDNASHGSLELSMCVFPFFDAYASHENPWTLDSMLQHGWNPVFQDGSLTHAEMPVGELNTPRQHQPWQSRKVHVCFPFL